MKILIPLMSLDIGGAETHVLELCLELARRGHEVYVASIGGTYVETLEQAGIRHFVVPLHNKKPMNIIKSYFLLKRIIKEERIEVVHAHARIPSFICGLVRRSRRFMFATTCHGVYNLSFPLKHLTNWGDYTLAVSQDIKEYLMTNYKLAEERIMLTVNGIDSERFSPDTDYTDVLEELGLTEESRKIVYVSRLDTDQSIGAKLLIEGAAEIKDTYIIIVGSGDDIAEVRRMAYEANAKAGRSVVKMTGSRTDVNKLVAMADVCVGLSRAALEAMSAGVPVILAGRQGYLGIFDRSKLDAAIATNFTCRGLDVLQKDRLVRDCINVLTMDEDRYKALSVFGREVVKEYYSTKAVADDALKAYRFKNDILISGYYGYHNSGDDALLKAIIDNLKSLKPDIRITVLSNIPKETSRIYGVESINRFNFIKIINLLKNTRLLISGGGSLIQDVTSKESLMYYLSIIRLAQRMGTKVMLYANGIGPVNNEGSRRSVKKILNMVECITLRESNSFSELLKMGVDKPPIHVLADPAFSLAGTPIQIARGMLEGYGIGRKDRYCIISVRSWEKADRHFADKLERFCLYIKEKYGIHSVFIPMHYPVDVNMTSRIAGAVGVMIDKKIETEHILGMTAGAEFTVGMRLHAIIYSAVVGTPVIGLVYDPKVMAFMEEIKQEYCINAENVDYEQLRRFADEIVRNRAEIKLDLERTSVEMRKKATENATIAINML